jgi:hypothetical protein
VVVSLRCSCSCLWLDKKYKNKSYVCPFNLFFHGAWLCHKPFFVVLFKLGVIYLDDVDVNLLTKVVTRYKNCSRLTPQAMSSVDTVVASHPYLPSPPQAETTADGLGWLLHAQRGLGGTKSAMGRRRLPWLRREVHLAAHFVSVLCVVLRGRHHRPWAENRIISNINHKMF